MSPKAAHSSDLVGPRQGDWIRMDKNQREARRHQEDVALTRALLWIAAAVVLEGLLVLVNRFYINYYVSEIEIVVALQSVLKVIRIAGVVVAAICVVWAFLKARGGQKAILPLLIAVGGGALTICSHVVLKYKSTGMSMLFWLVVAWAVLAVIYYIYQKEFFLSATATGMSVLALWFVRYASGVSYEVALILVAIILVLAVTLFLKKHDGLLPLKTPVPFLPAGCSYSVILASCLASILVVVAALVAGAAVAYYLIFVMLAWIFALFVYYTVKMM